MWGYIVVNISAGYMFGTWRGLAVTVTTATAGVFVAHILIRLCLREVSDATSVWSGPYSERIEDLTKEEVKEEEEEEKVYMFEP